MKRYYGFSAFVGDVVMTAITLGLWLIWIFIREINLRERRYGFNNFIGDLTLAGCTCGIWLIWVVIREININR